MKKRNFIFLLFLMGVNVLKGQDFTFSQFNESPLLRNPSLGGLMQGNFRVVSQYRNQWAAVTVPFQTQALSVEMRLPFEKTNDFLTTGIQFTRDIAGDSKLSRNQYLPFVTFHKSIYGDVDEVTNYLNFSIMGGAVQSQFDPTKLVFSDPNNPPVFTTTSLSYGDLSAGLSLNSVNLDRIKYYVGLAGYHLIKSKVGFINTEKILLKPRYSLNVGFSMNTGDDYRDRFYGYGDYNIQGGNRQVLLGVYYRRLLNDGYDNDDEELTTTSITGGVSYRWKDAIIPVLKLTRQKFFIGASYDFNISKLTTASHYMGGLEISAGVLTALPIIHDEFTKDRNVPCPGL